MKGSKEYQHKDNPDEKLFHDKFIEHFGENYRSRTALSAIVNGWANGSQSYPKEYLTADEERICINLIQWLGSPVGQSFLRDCGFEKIKENEV